MNIKDAYIHNGEAILKDIQISGSKLQKLKAGKNADDTYLTWVDVLDLSPFGASGHNHDDRYVKKGGDTMTGLLTTTSGGNHKGIKVGDTYINAIGSDLIFQNNGTIRFGGDSWDYNVWAGLKYVHSSKTIYLGLADGSAFTANSAQSGGKLYTPGISDIYIGNGTYTVYHTNNLSIKTLMGTTAIGDADEPVYWNGSSFVKAGAYPTKASWNYDDRYLKLSGGTLTGKLTIKTNGFGNQLTLDRGSDGGSWGPGIMFYDNGTFLASLGVDTSGTLYKGDNGSTKYAIYHAGNLTASVIGGLGTLSNNISGNAATATNSNFFVGCNNTITVEGDSNTYYPVMIATTTNKKSSNIITIWKDLGSKTASYPENHSNGSSSMLYRYDIRNNYWDGNGGYCITLDARYIYARLVSETTMLNMGVGNFCIWLRGGGTEYNINTSWYISSTDINVYYSSTNVGSSTYPVTVAPRTDIGNEGVFNTRTIPCNVKYAATANWATSAGSATYVLDVNGSSATTFAYSKPGLGYDDYNWLAGWNGYELRAINKSQFAQASHTHTKSQITDFPTSLPASGGYANEIASKGILDSQEKIDNFITPNRFEYALFKTANANNVDFANNDGMLLSIPWNSTSFGAQLAFDDAHTSTIKVRSKVTSWGNWYTLLHSGNYTTYTVKKDGTGASGTWDISITGNAATATALTTNAGSTNIPIYFTGGKPSAVSITAGTANIERPFVLVNDNNELYKTSGITANYSKNSITATTFKGNLEGNAKTATSLGSGALKYMCSLYTTNTYNAYKIVTDWHKSNNIMPTINIRGYAYGSAKTIDCDIVMYHYANEVHSYSLTNKGSYPISVWQAIENDVQVFYINPGEYYGMFNVFVYGGIGTNTFSNWSMTAVDEVSGTEIESKPIATSITGNAKTATTSTYASNVGSSGTAGTNYVTASKVISACNWYDTMIGSDSDTVINRWSEIVSFVAGFKETPDLATFLSNNYLAKAGGTMTGPLKWANAIALPQQTSPQYFLCIDAFDAGGTTKWADKADTLNALTGLTSTAIGDSDEPVYWNGSKFVKAGAYPTKSSWNYDDRYLKLSGGNLTGGLSIQTQDYEKGYATSQQLVINGPNYDANATLTPQSYPGIGFHMPNRTWANLIWNGSFTGMDGSFNGYVSFYGSGFKKDGSSDNYVLLGGGGHKLLSDLSMTHSHPYSKLTTYSLEAGASIIVTNSGSCIAFSRRSNGGGSKVWTFTGYGATYIRNNITIIDNTDTHISLYNCDSSGFVIKNTANNTATITIISNDIPTFTIYDSTTHGDLSENSVKTVSYNDHTHTFASLTSKPTTIAGYGITDAYTTSTIDNKLSTYLPLAGGQMNNDAFIAWNKGSNGNDLADWSITDNGLRIISSVSSTSKAPTQYATGLHVKGRYGFQIASQGGSTSNEFFIKNVHNTTWNTLLHSNNYTTYTVKKDGTGASGVWEIGITGNAGTSNRTKFLETFQQNSTTTTYGAQYPIWAQWSDSANVRLKCTNYTVWTDKADNAINADKLDNYHENDFFRYRGQLYQKHDYDANTLGIGEYIFRSSSYSGVGTGAEHVNALNENSTIQVFKWLQMSAAAWSDSMSYRLNWGGETNTQRPYGWSPWITFISSSNYTEYTVKKDGTGATGTWRINVTGSAGSVERATFGDGSNATHDANAMTSNGLYYYSSNGPTINAHNFATNDAAMYVQAYNSSWVSQIAQDYRSGKLAVRSRNNGTWQPWRRIAFADSDYVISADRMYYEPEHRKFTRTASGNSWDTQAYSVCGYKECRVTYKISQTSAYIMVGLNSDPDTNASFTSIDYCWYTDGGGSLSIYENGSYISSISGHTTYTVGDEFIVEYSCGQVRYYHNGVLCRTVVRTYGSPLYFDCSFYNAGSIENVVFEPIHNSLDFVQTTASYSLSNAAWTNTITLPTTAGSYILNIVSGNSTLTGVFSIGTSDNAKDEISLHLHGNGPRLYARTNGTTLQLSSNDASATSRSVTIKYRRMI